MKTAIKTDYWHVLPTNAGQIVTIYTAQTPGAGEGECRRRNRGLELRHDRGGDTWAIYRRGVAVMRGTGRTWPMPDAV